MSALSVTNGTSFRDKPTLIGDLVVLRPVTEDDASALAEIGPETLRFTGTEGRCASRALRS